MRVVAVNGNEAEVEQGGTKLQVRVDLVEDVRVGDYVLVHAGFAIQKLDEEEAFETLRLLEMLGMSPLDDGTSMSNVE
jgi:hydrogenase expression/formation protein HypC